MHWSGRVVCGIKKFICIFSCCWACTPVIPKCYEYSTCGPTYEALTKVLTEADRTKKDGMVYLPFVSSTSQSTAPAKRVTAVPPKPESIFIIPMENVTVRRFGDAIFNCTFNRTFPFDDAWEDFMWRFNSKIIRAPEKHPFHGFERYYDQRQGRLGGAEHPLFNISTTRRLQLNIWKNEDPRAVLYWTFLRLHKVDLYTSARVECWVRTDPRDEWWMVQTAYLHVTWQTSI
ncbi:uncharacterized protein LOC129595729 [Paramacrobiotus metropolitanus]|uniref:uncharacterized protein LOC129595729 n=1 Tax=Paramacrobiotus metropolitanus TaxID=2943436 RepID=UPI0024458794|nr:uncharacterized protein LOC129595729 [Paramacrobiotus metropolitanus]